MHAKKVQQLADNKTISLGLRFASSKNSSHDKGKEKPGQPIRGSAGRQESFKAFLKAFGSFR